MAGQSRCRVEETPRSKEEMWDHAKDFLDQYFSSSDSLQSPEHLNRLDEVREEIDKNGTYDVTKEELIYGSKSAWRTAARCVARILWNTLNVLDFRHIKTAKEMFEGLCEHLEFATNGGNIRSTISVFPKRIAGRADFRLWNPLLLCFAGYQQPDGSVIGDPAFVQFTQVCQSLGWKGKGGRFDVLPLVVSVPGEKPQFFDIPPELALRIPLSHPDYPWFADMGLQWFAIPAVSDMRMDLGGLEFTATPFNGWYTVPEVGTRDLCDPHRYNVLKEVAEKMGLDTESNESLWKDRALVVVNQAVVHGYRVQGVTIVDHHTAAESFLKFMEQENKMRGGCNADWVWIVPPIGTNLVPTFQQDMVNYNLKPSYEYQERAWKPIEN
uniref:nitric-oxide synthase (NADPH) n=1 Tax=Strigamia maritima TaxID=126957 RepID=T1IJV5_STRMM